jgi:hypothetical protein
MEELGRLIPELLQKLQGVNINFNFGSSAVTVAAYIFMALGLFGMAQNRGLKNPWLAWIPVANLWLLGCISDQYHYVTRGKECNRRTKLLTLKILEAGILALFLCVCGCLLLLTVTTRASGFHNGGVSTMVLLAAVFTLSILGLLVVAVLLQIQKCRGYYDIFASCVPRQKNLYATWSIIASCLGVELVAAILIFTCRNQEKGMPPRKAE